MSLKAALTNALRDEPGIKHVVVKDGVMHGEPGRYVKVVGEATYIEIFIADDRKVNDAHAITIIQSYLHNMKHNREAKVGEGK